MLLTLAESVPDADAPLPSRYVQAGSSIGLTNFTFCPLSYSHPHVRSFYFTFLSESVMHRNAGLSHLPGPTEISSNSYLGKAPTCHFSQPQQCH